MATATQSTLTLVVSTLGTRPALRELVESVGTQLSADDTIVVVSQDNHDRVDEMLGGYSGPALLVRAQSGRGATLGRNSGVRATKRGEVLLFPNDTSTYPQGSIASIRAAATHDVLVVTVKDDTGAKFAFAPGERPLTYRNVWDIIEPGLIVRRSAFEALGGFDERIGTGAPSPWQAGEAADLMWRWAADHPDASIRWEPKIVVAGVTDSAGLSQAERRRKLRAYGRGCGHLMSVYRAPLWFRVAYIVAGFAVALRRPGVYRLTDGWWAALGRWEGVTGRIRGGAFSAVSR